MPTPPTKTRLFVMRPIMSRLIIAVIEPIGTVGLLTKCAEPRQPDLLGRKRHEQRRALPLPVVIGGEPRELHHARGPRRIVVGAVMDLSDL